MYFFICEINTSFLAIAERLYYYTICITWLQAYITLLQKKYYNALFFKKLVHFYNFFCAFALFFKKTVHFHQKKTVFALSFYRCNTSPHLTFLASLNNSLSFFVTTICLIPSSEQTSKVIFPGSITGCLRTLTIPFTLNSSLQTAI